jgi:hypothetical protein
MTFPKAALWRRLDVPGAEHVLYDDRRGLTAQGVQLAHEQQAYRVSYELTTDERWATTRLDVTAEGPGWQRRVLLARDKQWRVTASERGDLPGGHMAGIEDPYRLDDALDVDLAASPLTNTLPIRRLGLLGAPAGTQHTILAAWVIVPSLTVVPDKQTYTVLDGRRVRYASGDFTAVVELDTDGFVTRYESLAERAEAQATHEPDR